MTRYVLLILTLCATATADTVRLRDVAGVKQDVILLGDVANLKGKSAKAMGRIVVGRFEPRQARRPVKLTTIRAILDGMGVNWGKLALGGYRVCSVTRLNPAPATQDDSAVVTNPTQPIASGTKVSVKQQVMEQIARTAGASVNDLVIQFNANEAEVLGQSAVGRQLEITPRSTATLGRIPYTIREWRNRRVIQEHRVTADVALRTLAVVATNAMQRNAPISHGDVEVREVLVHDTRGRPLTSLDQVVGQATRGAVRAGAMIYPDDLRSPLLVRRNEIIEVRGIYGGLIFTTTARAREDGEADQIIMARRDGSKSTFPVRVIGLRRGEVVTRTSATQKSALISRTERMAHR